MSHRGDRCKELNAIDASNVDFCELLTSSHTLEEFFPDHPYLVSIFKNYRSRKLNELTLFWCVLISFMHWSCETKLHDKEKSDYTILKLYGILREDSVSHKSGYIKPIRKAFDFVEEYFRSQLTDSNDKFVSTCLENLTPAKSLVELELSSKFISSDEDHPLTDFSFFEPSTPKAKESQPYLTTAFNGAYKLQKFTMTYSKDIRDKSLTMLIPTTGDRWSSLLEYFDDSSKTNESLLNEELPCLEYLFITRMLIGNRVYEYDHDTSNYLRPILYKMRSNGLPYDGLFNVPENKRAESCERRGADLIERITVIIQNMFDTLKVLESIKSINFHCIKKDTLNEIKLNIGNYFYPNEMLRDHKRDRIDVKRLLANLEKKSFLKHGKFVKSSFRLIESWIKILPEPTADEQIEDFRKKLNSEYQLSLQKYLDYYKHGVDNKSLLNETGYNILTTQRSWIEKIQQKIHSPSILKKSLDVVQDVADLIDYNITSESIDIIQDINIPSMIEDNAEFSIENNSTTLSDNMLLRSVIENCLSDVIEQVIDSTNTNDEQIIDSIQCQNITISSSVISTTCAPSSDILIPEDMKILCKKILLSDSIVLSSTKLNKTCKTNMVDVHKACQLLIDYKLLIKENKMLANKSSYHECYLKNIPQNKSASVEFSITLTKFGIYDINMYYDTLKTIDTRNTTYLSPYGVSILEQKPYNDFKIIVNKDAIVQPSKERYRKLTDASVVTQDGNKENMTCEVTDESTDVGHNLDHEVSSPKRRRELTGKGKTYNEERSKSKKKKNNV
ncbi:hypothetical protein I4U23_004310 [Adineta vaga]|nr:hypothetical protein I4U23_004310 [Adineta vaga]